MKTKIFFPTVESIFLLALPEIEHFSFNENGVNGGSSVRVLCSLVNGDQPVEILWLKDGKQLTEYRRKVQKLDENTVILSLRKMQLEDSGNYTCVAKNRAGTTSHSAILKVKGIVDRRFHLFS